MLRVEEKMVLAFLKSVFLNMRLLEVCAWGSGFNGKKSKTQRKSLIDLPKVPIFFGPEESLRLFALHNQKWCEIGGPTGCVELRSA